LYLLFLQSNLLFVQILLISGERRRAEIIRTELCGAHP
jgi:hypothetical protein